MKTITLIIATVVISCTGLTAQIAAQGGYALEFDGSNDYITFGSDPSLIITASVTIEAWVNLETTGQQCFVAGKIKHGNPQYGYGMYINNGNLGGDAGQVTFIAGRSWFDWPSVRSNARLNTNEWYHIVGTFDGRYLKLYVNGKLDNTYDYGSVYTINDSGDNFKIGYNSNLGSNYFSGKIDEVRVWNTARTEAQIKTNMYKELVGNEAGLMAYYKMNDGSGTSLTDNSTNSNTGTLTNGPEWKLSGCFGGSRQALDLDGVDDYVNLGNSFDLKPANALTFECWLNANDWNPTATHQVFAGNTQGGGYNFAIGYPTSNDVGFAVYSSGAYRRVDASIADFDGWHHIAGTFDGQYVKIYIDGILYDTENIGSSGNTITYDGDNSTILGEEAGALNIPAGYNFAGKIDEVRFWNTARTEAQIQENMMKTLAGNEAGLVAYYRMDQYDGTTLYDLTSNGLNGILYNMNVSDWVSSIAFNTWIGSDDNSWTNANNWTNGAPASGQSLGFYNSTNDVDFTLNSGLNYGSLFLSGVNSLNFDSNTDLSFDGNVINNGEISIFSNTSGDASLIIDGDITGSGIYNVERYLSANTWHLVTSPITTGTAGVFEDIWLRPYDEAHNTFGDYIVPTETPMPTGEGFSVWANTNETRTFTGTINNDAVNLTLQRTPDGGDVLNFGWNLIGNPYPCAIDLDAASGWTKNNVGRAVYVWDGGLSGGQYRVYLAATGTEQGIAANGGSRYVAMGQGFFVQAITDGATITMDKPVRVHNAIEFRDSEMIPDMININVSGNGYFDESVIYYKAEASENFDFDYDAAKLYGTSAAPQLYTKKQDNLLTINSINDFDELNGKYVYLEVGAAGEYMFEFSHSLAGYSPGVRDLFTDQYIYPEQNYVFFANPDDNPQRFQFAYDFTSIDEESKNDISVWAFENILRVEAQNGEAINEISIYSIHGQLLMKFNETEKDLSGLAPAVYVVRVNSNDEVKIEKIVIK